MSKRVDDNWGEKWSREKEMDCQVALQTLATAVWSNWKREIDSNKDYPRMVCLGNIHDLWNTMYGDMKALYTLEQLVNTHYTTKMIDGKGEDSNEQV